MEPFKKTINNIDFEFQGIMEGEHECCRVRTDNHEFKMTVDNNGNWEILQQVPVWVKELEQPLGDAIDEVYGEENE